MTYEGHNKEINSQCAELLLRPCTYDTSSRLLTALLFIPPIQPYPLITSLIQHALKVMGMTNITSITN